MVRKPMRPCASSLACCSFATVTKGFGLFGGVNGATAPLLSLFGIAGLIEVIAGALITVGWFAATAAFVASGQMAGGVLSSLISLRVFGPFKTAARKRFSTAFVFSLHGDPRRGHMEHRRRIEANRLTALAAAGALNYVIDITGNLQASLAQLSIRRSAMKDGFKVIDADRHILEPTDLYQKYLPEKFKKPRAACRTEPDGA
jgi:hypothetical protein